MMDIVTLLFENKGVLAKDTLFRLEKEYGIVMTREESEDIEKMCNWSVYKYRQGYEDAEKKAEKKAELRNNEIVMSMLKDGISENMIMKWTGITTEKLIELKQQLSINY